MLTISLVSMFLKLLKKLASRVFKTRVQWRNSSLWLKFHEVAKLKWKKNSHGTRVFKTRVPQRKTKRRNKKNVGHFFFFEPLLLPPKKINEFLQKTKETTKIETQSKRSKQKPQTPREIKTKTRSNKPKEIKNINHEEGSKQRLGLNLDDEGSRWRFYSNSLTSSSSSSWSIARIRFVIFAK